MDWMKSLLILKLCFLLLGSRINGLQCRQCTRSMHDLSDCPLVTCEENQLCYSSDSISLLLSTQHYAKCLHDMECRRLTRLVMEYMHTSNSLFGRKRNIHTCDICCGSDDCNSKTCHQLKHDMFYLYRNHQLNMTSLSAIIPDNN